jgi:hypothetical protein
MKRVILSAILLFGITTLISAQTKNSKQSSKTMKSVTIKSAKNKKTAKAPKAKADTVTLSNRKIYHWSNGQRSTPTGQDATSSNGSSYSALKKDTAKVVGKRKQ